MSAKAKEKGDGKSDKTNDRPKGNAASDSSGDEEEGGFEDEVGGIRIEDIYIPPAPRPACTFDTTGPRLIITHIENENFKSYAGKQVLGPLHKSFTSIVGPNGSGKSNVIDSMLFVFGYRAAKIRSKKISVLLHNSEQHQNVKSCTVTVHFQLIIDKPGEDFEVVPNSQIAVSRTAFRDNSSYYTIGGRRVQFKEVAKLLQNHGIDLDHNRFLILQGEVEQIAMMKPIAPNEHETGMLEYLEDIIGTNRFKEPLKKLFNRVEQLTEEKADKMARVKMVEKEKDALEIHKNEAIQFLQMQNDVTEGTNTLCQKQILINKTCMAEKEERKKAVDKELAKLQEHLDSIHEEKSSKNEELKVQSKLMEELTARQDEVKKTFDATSKRDMNLQEDIKQVSAKRKRTKGDLKKEREKLQELERVPEKNTKAIEELVAHEQSLSKDLEKEEAAKDKLMAGLAVETKGLKESKDKLENELIGLKKTVDETKSANDITKKELELYLSSEQKEQTKLEQIRTNYKAASEKVSARKPQIKELKAKIPTMEDELRAAQVEYNEVVQQEKLVSTQLRSARSTVEETRSSMQATRSKGRVLDFLMKLKADGKLPGIYGRMGDLGAIDKKYDIAVSTACGPLDHILVDTNETGQECIRLLKQHDVGRANFIILNKQDSLLAYCNSSYQYPENVLRLFDLITIPDERVRTAFYFGCRETLVANDMDQATRIGYGQTRYRVVTLKGELIETSGTMSGGGRPSSGRMGQAVAVTNAATPGQIQKMERNVEQLESRATDLRQSHDRLQGVLKHLPVQLKTMAMDLKKYTAEIQSAIEQEPMLKEQVAKQEDKVKSAAPDAREVNKLEAAVKKTQAAFDEAAEAAEKVNSKVKKLHAQIMEMTGGRVGAAQKKVNDLGARVEKVRQEMTKLKVAIKTADRNAIKCREKIGNMEQEIADAEGNLRKMQEETQAIDARGRDLINEAKEKTTERLEKEANLAELKQEIADISKREVDAKSSRMEVEQKVGAAKKEIEDYQIHLKSWNHKRKALKLQKIPGVETELVLRVFSDEELAEKELETLRSDLVELENKLIGKVSNIGAIEEYQKIEAQYLKRVEELEVMIARRTEMRNKYEELRKARLVEFLAGYNIITSKLKEMYQMITLGGDAELELVDSLDPFSEGVIFSVRPPKKSWKNIANLSGGEKTLSSLALVFALHYYKPSPLYVMDEIDAALDFKNVSIVGNYIKERTKNAQFIIISLRANMFELADRLIGIYKVHNATKSCALNPRLYGKQPVQTLTQTQRICSDQNIKPDASKPTLGKVQSSSVPVSQKSKDQQFQALFDQGSASNELSPNKNKKSPVLSLSEQRKRKSESDADETQSKKLFQESI